MKFLNLILLFLGSILFSVSVVSCNKDEVIKADPENPGDPDKPGENGFRPSDSKSSSYISKVFEWTPAPGQFINDFGKDFPDVNNVTADDAALWAFNRLNERLYVSLGAFGGYLIAGFDHSILKTGEYEIGILGNAFLSANGCSDEPGIVYVMKDENKNGIPDDTWYELKGSDTFAPGTIHNYEVTYYRPDANGKDVDWTDNLGHSGKISYLSAFHNQPSYYPVWVTEDTYKLSGTCLEAKTIKNPETGNWENPPFQWGYADNIGSDNIEFEGMPNCNRFRISDAIDENGESVNLDFIDFIKVQTGVSASAGWLGEVSTEVLGIIDLSL